MSIYLTLTPSSPEAFAWIDADGNEHALDYATTGYMVLEGITDRWLPPVEWVEDGVPYIDGAVFRDVNVRPLDWTLPVLVTGSTPAQLHQRVRDLVTWMAPQRGDGVFKNTAADGETRKLTCRVESLDFVEESPPHRRIVVSLHAADPYWYADEATAETFTVNVGDPDPFLDPGGFFPLGLSSSVFFAGPSVDNPGDVESWPTWTIQGPGVNPSLRNVTTGEVMTFSRTLGAGEMIVIELRRDSATITDGLGTRLYSALSNPSTVWPIQPGINRLQIGMSGATDASSVTLTYTPRFLGP